MPDKMLDTAVMAQAPAIVAAAVTALAGTPEELLTALVGGTYELLSSVAETDVETVAAARDAAEALVEAVAALAEVADAEPGDMGDAGDVEEEASPARAVTLATDWWDTRSLAKTRDAGTLPHKRTLDVAARTADVGGRRMVVASTARVDRYGDIIDQPSIRLENYEANPIMLFQHSASDVIGNAKDVAVRTVGGRPALTFEPAFDEAEDNPLARRTARQWRDGILRTVSIGFLPDYERACARRELPPEHWARGETGYYYEGVEITEISVVSVPANPDAMNMPSKAAPAKAAPTPAQDWWD